MAEAPVALVCSVALECALVEGWLEDATPGWVGGKPARRGRLAATPVVLLQCGMGKANAAHALTALLERQVVRAVLGFGVAGAYPGAGLRPADVAIATASIYADDGVQAPDGWLGTEAIGIPLAEREGRRWFNRFDADPALLQRVCDTVRQAGIPVACGPFLTVSCCSGTAARGRELEARWGAICEGMEGAALAQVAALYGVPFLELRGVSNLVEDRDLSSWRLREAAESAQHAVRAALATWAA